MTSQGELPGPGNILAPVLDGGNVSVCFMVIRYSFLMYDLLTSCKSQIQKQNISRT